ncbi:MAG TPA: hypothetical protein VF283_22620 [Bryobacteraceae bacterium]
MDVKNYYRKVREMEHTLRDEFLLLVSLETPDGGKPGVISEVARALAAKLLVEGRSALASEEQKKAYRHQQTAERKAAEQAKLARTVQVAILSDAEFQARPVRERSGDSHSEK